ncbi:MAG TPA: hypothetical protein DHU96_04035 [Actinobacteria bacterium]|nr:hypothetical protein [Actinomycetota bacterium]
MQLITREERDEFFTRFRLAALHLEMRDSYGTQVEKPHLHKWERGEPDDIEWLKPWFETVRTSTQSGKVFRRIRIISEPITDYIRWEHMDAHLFVEAGEDIRWLPRRLVSAIAFPGNDFWLFDAETAIFSVFSGNGDVVERQLYTDTAVVQLCQSAFDSAWELAIPHSEYKPG